MSRHKSLNPPDLPAARGFSHAVIASGRRVVFLAGQIGWDGQGRMVSDDLVGQFEKALANVAHVVREAGGSCEDIVRLTIYVTDAAEYRSRLRELGEAYRRVMGRHYPAMALLEVKGLFEPAAKVELEATAAL